MRVLIASALALLALTAVAAAEMSPVPFVLGSRYGRAAPRQIAPRNDRFFMGSRYGKRGDPPAPPGPLACHYTGVGALFRCQPTPATGDQGRTQNTFMRLEDDSWQPER